MDERILNIILKVLLILALFVFIVYGILIIAPAMLVSVCANTVGG